PGPLPAFDRVAEQRLHDRTGRSLLARLLPRVTDLAEDLALSEDRRVEPGGHLEQMGDGGLLVVRVEVVAEALGRGAGELGQEVAHVPDGAVEALGLGVDLGAHARGKQHGFEDVRAVMQIVQGLGQTGLGHGHALEQLERHRPVVEAHDYDRHACSRSLTSSSRPSRTSSSISTSSTDRQFTASVERPAARISSRCSERRRASTPSSGPSGPNSPWARRSRSHAANAGLVPSVETATATGSWRSRAGTWNELCTGSSATLTHTPAPPASAATISSRSACP